MHPVITSYETYKNRRKRLQNINMHIDWIIVYIISTRMVELKLNKKIHLLVERRG